MKSRWEELLAIVLIGDGMLNLIQPKRHTAIWHCGPASYRRIADKLEEHPSATRGIGFAFVTLGVWIATRAAKA